MMLKYTLVALLMVLAAGILGRLDGVSFALQPEAKKVYRHIVLFKFKEDASAEQIQEIVSAFKQLSNEINTIVAFEHGTDVSPEKLSKGFTHCFQVTFRTREDLEAYLPHPSHQAFTMKLKPILADVLVVDYWTEF
ncbi:MAG: Dabb family protein [Planctomycetaceae bacterium]